MKRDLSLLVKPLGALATLAVTYLLIVAGCTKSIEWREEIKLQNGKRIVVTQHVRQDRISSQIGGQYLRIRSTALTFKGETGEEIQWRGRGLMPMVLDIVGDVPYLATVPIVGEDFVKYGCPYPAYIFFKYIDSDWKQISFKEFPPELKNRNLLVQGLQNQISASLPGGAYSVEDKQNHITGKRSLLLPSDREIHPNATSGC